MLSPTTFVSCFVKVYDQEPYGHKTFEWRIEQFEKVLKTGVSIYLFVDSVTLPLVLPLLEKYPKQLYIDNITQLSDESIARMKAIDAYPYALPIHRNTSKDTFGYFKCMHGKIDCVMKAISVNPFESTHFAWMDVSMAYLFSNETTVYKLTELANQKRSPGIYIPGCWNRYDSTKPDTVTNSIHWRFCGTFWVGDEESIRIFYSEYVKQWNTFHEITNHTFTWEVNYWAWLETESPTIPFIWYASDHNDRLLTDFPNLY